MSHMRSFRTAISIMVTLSALSCSVLTKTITPSGSTPAAPTQADATSITTEPTQEAPSPTATDELLTFPAQPDPLDVTVTLDNDRAVSELIPVSGGTLEATGADGSVFTLAIPENALLSDEEITMTPVSKLEGSPFSGAKAVVQLEPEGLELFAPAILTIKPAFDIPPGEEASFAYYQLGEDFHLYPLLPDPQAISFPIIHFSGYGVGRGTPGQQTAMPGSAEAQLNQALSRKIAEARRHALLGQEEVKIDFETHFQQYFDQVIKPILQAAGKDCEAAIKGIPKALGWAQQVQRLGFGDHFANEIAEVMKTTVVALVNCYNKAHAKCGNDHDPDQATVMLTILRQLKFLGFEDSVDETKISKCLTFKLKFNSRFEGTSPPTIFVAQSVQHVVATVKFRLVLTFGGFAIQDPSAPLDFVEFTTDIKIPKPCKMEAIAVGSVFTIVKFLFPLNVTEGNAPPKHITMLIQPGTTGESAHVTCPGQKASVGDVIPPGPRWHETFEIHHGKEKIAQGTYAIRDWNITGGELYATRFFEFQLASQGAEYTENTTLELHHTPEP